MTYGDKPFGIYDIKLTNLAGTTQVDLPYAMRMKFSERVVSGELRGDGKTVSVVAEADAHRTTEMLRAAGEEPVVVGGVSEGGAGGCVLE